MCSLAVVLGDVDFIVVVVIVVVADSVVDLDVVVQ